MSHLKYSPVGYDYGQYNYCLDCIPKVAAIPNVYGLDEHGRKQIMINNGRQGFSRKGCNCAECRLDRMAEARGINRYNESSFSQSEFPKAIPYHNDLHIDCEPPSDEYPDGRCYGRCAQCREVIDGISHLNGPDTCPVIDE